MATQEGRVAEGDEEGGVSVHPHSLGGALWREVCEGILALHGRERDAIVVKEFKRVVFGERDRSDPQKSSAIAVLRCPSIEEAKRLGRRWVDTGVLPVGAEKVTK